MRMGGSAPARHCPWRVPPTGGGECVLPHGGLTAGAHPVVRSCHVIADETCQHGVKEKEDEGDGEAVHDDDDPARGGDDAGDGVHDHACDEEDRQHDGGDGHRDDCAEHLKPSVSSGARGRRGCMRGGPECGAGAQRCENDVRPHEDNAGARVECVTRTNSQGK